jgi:hypothetical protein
VRAGVLGAALLAAHEVEESTGGSGVDGSAYSAGDRRAAGEAHG